MRCGLQYEMQPIKELQTTVERKCCFLRLLYHFKNIQLPVQSVTYITTALYGKTQALQLFQRFIDSIEIECDLFLKKYMLSI